MFALDPNHVIPEKYLQIWISFCFRKSIHSGCLMRFFFYSFIWLFIYFFASASSASSSSVMLSEWPFFLTHLWAGGRSVNDLAVSAYTQLRKEWMNKGSCPGGAGRCYLHHTAAPACRETHAALPEHLLGPSRARLHEIKSSPVSN